MINYFTYTIFLMAWISIIVCLINDDDLTSLMYGLFVLGLCISLLIGSFKYIDDKSSFKKEIKPYIRPIFHTIGEKL